jgi:uncharacterized protein YqjF (DUF2071 family)
VTLLAPPAAPAARPAPAAVPGRDSARARERLEREGGALFVADWVRALFLHYAVPPAALQPFVPFPLDLRDGSAWVSLVSFTMVGMRPARGGRAAALATRPLATHGFLNVRTYVRHLGEPGIHFLAEWIPNRLAVLLGPPLFGLPYRLGRLEVRHDLEAGVLEGEVVPAGLRGRLAYRAVPRPGARAAVSAPGSLAEFLCERYAAFTWTPGRVRLFRVWHPPWPLLPVDAEVEEDALSPATGAWARAARPVAADYSPGVAGVRIGPPRAA